MWLVFNVVFVILCFWFILGVNVSLEYDVNQSVISSKEVVVRTLETYLKASEMQLWFLIVAVVVNIAVLVLNNRRIKHRLTSASS